MALEQEGFRFYYDDGAESASTPIAAQDQSIVHSLGVSTAIRILLNATGDPANQAYTLQARKNAGTWAAVAVASSVVPSFDVAAGAASTGVQNNVSVPYPSGLTADSHIFMFIAGRHSTASVLVTTPTGWTAVDVFESGTGTFGNGTGNRMCALFKKDTVTGSESGNLTVSWASSPSTGAVLIGCMVRVNVPTGHTLSYSTAHSRDTSVGTSWSATALSSLDFQNKDYLIGAAAGSANDPNAATSLSLTASGVTFGTAASLQQAATSVQNDVTLYVHSATASAPAIGSATTVAPNQSFTTQASTWCRPVPTPALDPAQYRCGALEQHRCRRRSNHGEAGGAEREEHIGLRDRAPMG